MPDPEEYKRDALDRFYTDPALALVFAREALKLFGSKRIEYFLEPSCGSGALIGALGLAAQAEGTTVDWCHAVDLDPSCVPDSSGLECPHFKFTNGAWLDVRSEHVARADLILANPPFAKTVPGKKPNSKKRIAIIQEHVQAMHASLSDGGLCGVLSRQSFLGKPRDKWLSSVARPFKIQQLSPRPSFTENGRTDGAEYILTWWEMFEGSVHAPSTEFEWLRWK